MLPFSFYSSAKGSVATRLIPLLVFASYGIPAKAQTSVAAMPAAAFLDTLGVTVHMEYTDGKYANVNNVKNDLAFLGVKNVRDGVPQPTHWGPPGQGVAAMKALAAVGIKFDIVVSDTDLATDMAQITALQSACPGMIAAIEGPNEINNCPVTYRGYSGETAALSFQRDLYSAVHQAASTRGVPVYYFTGGSPISPAKLAGMADVANGHPYPHHGDQPAKWLATEFAADYPGAAGVRKAITETGYYTAPQNLNWGGVDGLTQAKGILSIYFDAATQGIEHSYMYQLLDAYSDPSGANPDHHFGFFELDNVPKPSAVAVHNLTTFLADSKVVSRSLKYELIRAPATVNQLLLSKSDGSFVLAVWNEVPFWNFAQTQPVTAQPVSVTLNLGVLASSISSYDPLTGASAAIGTNVYGAVLSVPDHPVLIAIKP